MTRAMLSIRTKITLCETFWHSPPESESALEPECCWLLPAERNSAITSPTKCRRSRTGSVAALMNIPPEPKAAFSNPVLIAPTHNGGMDTAPPGGTSMRFGKQVAGLAVAIEVGSVAYARVPQDSPKQDM